MFQHQCLLCVSINVCHVSASMSAVFQHQCLPRYSINACHVCLHVLTHLQVSPPASSWSSMHACIGSAIQVYHSCKCFAAKFCTLIGLSEAFLAECRAPSFPASLGDQFWNWQSPEDTLWKKRQSHWKKLSKQTKCSPQALLWLSVLSAA